MFDNSLINPSALFEVSLPIHRLPEVLDMRSPETWGLDDKYKIPAIHVLNTQNSRQTSIRCAWNDQGLFLACKLSHKIPSGNQNTYALKIELAVHSRYSRDLRSRDDFSTHLVFDLRGPKFVDRLELECQGTTAVSSGFSSLTPSETRECMGTYAALHRSVDELKFWVSIRAEQLPKYSPFEFPDIALGLLTIEPPTRLLSLAQSGVQDFLSIPQSWFHLRCTE